MENPATERPAVVVEGITKRFGQVLAVDDLTLRIPRGDIFGLVGPDGAGKTTTFRLICGILTPDAGRIEVAGQDLAADPEAVKRRIGYLSQAFSQYNDLTVWENLRFTADIYSVPDGEWQQRAETLLQASRMSPFKNRLAGNLSGGMKQKLALSCALLHTPEIVFLDEPTTGVDPVSRRDFWSILYNLALEGVTIVLSTPYMDEAERCRRLAFMSHGRILATGSPAELKAGLSGEILVLATDAPRAARDLLLARDDVLDAVLFGDRLHAVVPNALAAEATLRRAIEAAGIAVHSIARAEPGLEDVFVQLAGRAGRPDQLKERAE